jgi:hypothetical protein
MGLTRNRQASRVWKEDTGAQPRESYEYQMRVVFKDNPFYIYNFPETDPNTR